MLTHLTLPADKLAELASFLKWVDDMPSALNEVVGDRFHENVVDRESEIADTDANMALLEQHDVYRCYLFLEDGQVFAAVESETGEPFSADQLAAVKHSEGGCELYIPYHAE